MAVVKYGQWEMIVTQEVADNPAESAKVIEALKEIVRVSDIEKAYDLTQTSA